MEILRKVQKKIHLVKLNASQEVFNPFAKGFRTKSEKYLKDVNNVTLRVSCVTLIGFDRPTFVQMINPLNYEKV
jgi:hypothetical protein